MATTTIFEDFEDTTYAIPWTGDWGIAARKGYEGRDCLGSTSAYKGPKLTTATFTINIPPGAQNAQVSFWWKLSTAILDSFIYKFNGAQMWNFDGITTWNQQTESLQVGTNTLFFSFSKNSSTSSGDNAAYIDAITVTYDLVNGQNYTITVTDTIPTSDSLTFIKSSLFTKLLTENISLNENVSKIFSISKLLTENIALGESISKTFWISKLLTESIALGENMNRAAMIKVVLQDIVSSSEIFRKIVNKELDDIISNSDQILNKLIKKAINENIVGSEIFVKNAKKELDDFVSSSDTIVKKMTVGILDSVSAGDSDKEQTSKKLTDTITWNDSISRFFSKTIIDNLSSSDSVSLSNEGDVHFNESIVIEDLIFKSLSKVKVDSIGLTDVDSKQQSKKLNDNISIIDAISKFFTKLTQDSVSFTDTMSEPNFIPGINEGSKSFNDYITISDSISKALSKSRNDGISLSEVENEKTIKELLESIATNDSIILTNGRIVLLSDNMLITDSKEKIISLLRQDNTPISDSTSKLNKLSLYDVIVTTDDINLLYNSPILIGEIHLEGQVNLKVYLVGRRDMNISLSGKQDMNIHLKGSFSLDTSLVGVQEEIIYLRGSL